jgi:hypothetical protein
MFYSLIGVRAVVFDKKGGKARHHNPVLKMATFNIKGGKKMYHNLLLQLKILRGINSYKKSNIIVKHKNCNIISHKNI